MRVCGAARDEVARQPLEQPGPEGIERLHPGEVDIDEAHRLGIGRLGVHQRLQVVGMHRRPGARRGEHQAVAVPAAAGLRSPFTIPPPPWRA